MLSEKQSPKFFRPILILALTLAVGLLAACSSTTLPDTGSLGTAVDQPPEAVLQTVERLSQELGVAVEEIEIVEFEQVEWPDACLGFPQEGQACAQVVTPGFRVLLAVGDQQYEFRSDESGTVIVKTTPEAPAP
ncbi:MAG TPA: hypothetical protein VN363_06490 [Anaerolineales bacterium]|nr:hypothetical protein [Anaerolineales bacterium]